MKFPYELSPSRLSLLSDEDKEIYEFEHSIYYSHESRERALQAIQNRQHYYYNALNENNEYTDLSEDEKHTIAKELTIQEMQVIYDDLEGFIAQPLLEVISMEDYLKCKEAFLNCMVEIVNNPEENALNEAEGRDITWWLPDGFKWIGTLAAGILGAGLAGIITLFMAGRDKMAQKMLEKYMNKLVELTDTGLHKKKSIFSFFSRDLTKYSGDQSRACFRSMQEIVERDLCVGTMIAGKACGFFKDDGFDAVKSAIDLEDTGAGLNSFIENVAKPIENFRIEG